MIKAITKYLHLRVAFMPMLGALAFFTMLVFCVIAIICPVLCLGLIFGPNSWIDWCIEQSKNKDEEDKTE